MLARPLPFARSSERSLTWPALADTACTQTGLDAFGDEAEFLPALERLLHALRDEAALNATGRELAHARLVGSLKNRLWAEACLRAEPAIAGLAMPAPIVLIGPHGSAAARLHRLLAADPQLAHLKTWEGLNPAPRAWPAAPDDAARRHHEAVKALAEQRRRNRHADALHPMRADAPDEETLLLDHAFCSVWPLTQYDLPGWYRGWLEADRRPGYRKLARWLRLVGRARGDTPGRRWVLRSPQHQFDLPALLAVFPDAKLVFVGREAEAAPGAVAAALGQAAALQSDRDVRASVCATWLDFGERAADRCRAARAAVPAAQQLDLTSERVQRDWRSAVQAVYGLAGLTLGTEAEDAMQREADSPRF